MRMPKRLGFTLSFSFYFSFFRRFFAASVSGFVFFLSSPSLPYTRSHWNLVCTNIRIATTKTQLNFLHADFFFHSLVLLIIIITSYYCFVLLWLQYCSNRQVRRLLQMNPPIQPLNGFMTSCAVYVRFALFNSLDEERRESKSVLLIRYFIFLLLFVQFVNFVAFRWLCEQACKQTNDKKNKKYVSKN